MSFIWGILVWLATFGTVAESGALAGPGESFAGPTLTRLAELQPDVTNRAVSIKAVVLCFDREWNQLYLHDGETTAYVPPEFLTSDVAVGDWVRLTGVAAPGDERVAIRGGNLEKLGTNSLPRAKRITLRQLESTRGEWVSVSGRVRVVETTSSRLVMVLEQGGHTCLLQVMGHTPDLDFSRLTGASIEARGINASRFEGERLTRAVVVVSGRSELKTLPPLGRPEVPVRVISVESLLNRELGPWTNRAVHLSGTVLSYKPGSSVWIQDPTGSIRAKVVQDAQLEEAELLELWGRLTVTPQEVLLTDSWFTITRSKAAESVGRTSPAVHAGKSGRAAPRTITSVQAVRDCSNDATGTGIPVRLRGVLTFYDAAWQAGFLQDATGAVYLELKDCLATAGEFVEIAGLTKQGQFAPIVQVQELRSLERGSFPSPVKAEVSELTEGQFDAKWVQLEGVVRRVQQEWGHARLVLSSAHGTFRAVIPGIEAPGPTNLVNVLVSVRGACGSDLNRRGQVTGITLHVPGLDCLTALEQVPRDPFGAEVVPINSIATFVPGRAENRRVKVRGLVTAVLPSGAFYLQDETGGIRVQTEGGGSLNPGGSVQVVGFPASGDPSPFLEDAMVQQDRERVFPPPIRTTAEEIVALGTNDAMLVELEGSVLQYTPKSVRGRLILQDGDIVYTALMMRRFEDASLPAIRNGSKVRVRGICRYAGASQTSESFRLLIFDPRSVQILEAVPWWTARHTLLLLGGVSAVALILLGWTALLRRQVRRQTQLIRRELKVRNAVAESLAYERDLLKTLLEHSPDAIFFKDLESRFVRVSKSKMESCYQAALDRHLQVHKDNGADCLPAHLASLEEFEKYVIGKTDADFAEEDRAEATRKEELEIIKTGRPLVGNITYRVLPGGQPCWKLVTKMPWRDKHGKIIGTFGLSKDITSIKEAEAKLESTHRELLVASRQAGMAEVATSVLHNVGNVLNSVNVSAGVLSSRIKESKIERLARVGDLLREHEDDLAGFLANDPKGRRVPEYLMQLSKHLAEEQELLLNELQSLSSNIDHIKEIVTMQQSYAKVAGVVETAKPADLVEDALRMNSGALARHEVFVERRYQPEVPEIPVERHKVLQILVNLIRNAKYACDDSGRRDKRITLSVHNGDGRVKISVADNGVGIPAEHMTRIFNNGFTTRKNGHGFGLHSGALAARELGGALHAASEGPGKGAVFTLELPVQRKETR